MCVQNKVPTVINMVLFLSVAEFLSGNSALILDTEVFNCRTTGSIVPVRKAGRNDFINRWAHQERVAHSLLFVVISGSLQLLQLPLTKWVHVLHVSIEDEKYLD